MATPTIADPTAAPLGREPIFLGVERIKPQPLSHAHYRTEAWQLANGARVVIVSDNGGASLVNIAESIASAIDDRWYEGGPPIDVIYDWLRPTTCGEETGRFWWGLGSGGMKLIDLAELDAKGLTLPR